MKHLLNIELKRAIKTRGMKISLIIGMTLCIAQVIQYMIPAYQANMLGTFKGSLLFVPYTAVETWIWGNAMQVESYIYSLILPLLAALPFATTYFKDYKSGFLKNIYMRVSRKNYLSAKYIAVFLSGGIAVVLPLILDLMCSLILLPNIVPSFVFPRIEITPKHMFLEIFFKNPLAYALIFLGITFIMGGIWAVICLASSFLSDYKFVVLVTPFFIQLLIDALAGIFNRQELSSAFFTRAGGGITNRWIFAGYVLIGLFASIILFRKKGEKEDVF